MAERKHELEEKTRQAEVDMGSLEQELKDLEKEILGTILSLVRPTNKYFFLQKIPTEVQQSRQCDATNF